MSEATTEKTLLLNNLSPAFGSKPNKKRKGRGHSAGQGKTCGRGVKGQTSRSGVSIPYGFEGGQTPIHRRLPKFGFRSRKSFVREELNLARLANLTDTVITLDSLKEMNFIKRNTLYVKIFGTAELKNALKIEGIPVSAGAKKLIEAAGGSVS